MSKLRLSPYFRANSFLSFIVNISVLISLYIQVLTLKTEDFVIEQDMNSEISNSLDYYSDFLKKYRLENKLSVSYFNNRINLIANQEIHSSSSAFNLPKSLILTSCDIFPYKELLIRAIIDYGSSIHIDITKFISPILITYRIMYLKFGNKDAAKNYYKGKLLHEYEKYEKLLSFEGNSELNLFLNQIPKKNKRSLFSFNKEEEKLAQDLKIETISKAIFENIHRYVLNHFKLKFDENIKVNFL